MQVVQADRQQAGGRAGRRAGRQAGRQVDRQAGRQAARQAGRQAGRQDNRGRSMTEVAYAHAHQANLALRMLLYVSRRPRNHGIARCIDSKHLCTGFNALEKTGAQYWRRGEPPVHAI